MNDTPTPSGETTAAYRRATIARYLTPRFAPLLDRLPTTVNGDIEGERIWQVMLRLAVRLHGTGNYRASANMRLAQMMETDSSAMSSWIRSNPDLLMLCDADLIELSSPCENRLRQAA